MEIKDYESHHSPITKISSWVPYVDKFDSMNFAQDYSYNTLEQRLCPSCTVEIIEQELLATTTTSAPTTTQPFDDETFKFAQYLYHLYYSRHVDMYYFDTLSPNIIGHTVDEQQQITIAYKVSEQETLKVSLQAAMDVSREAVALYIGRLKMEYGEEVAEKKDEL